MRKKIISASLLAILVLLLAFTTVLAFPYSTSRDITLTKFLNYGKVDGYTQTTTTIDYISCHVQLRAAGITVASDLTQRYNHYLAQAQASRTITGTKTAFGTHRWVEGAESLTLYSSDS